MNVHITPEQEARLTEIARRIGRQPDDLVQEAVNQLLGENARFLEAVEQGFRSLDAGRFITHEEVGARLARVFSS
jgi:predicted transcriptional regulator